MCHIVFSISTCSVTLAVFQFDILLYTIYYITLNRFVEKMFCLLQFILLIIVSIQIRDLHIYIYIY